MIFTQNKHSRSEKLMKNVSQKKKKKSLWIMYPNKEIHCIRSLQLLTKSLWVDFSIGLLLDVSIAISKSLNFFDMQPFTKDTFASQTKTFCALHRTYLKNYLQWTHLKNKCFDLKLLNILDHKHKWWTINGFPTSEAVW